MMPIQCCATSEASIGGVAVERLFALCLVPRWVGMNEQRHAVQCVVLSIILVGDLESCSTASWTAVSPSSTSTPRCWAVRYCPLSWFENARRRGIPTSTIYGMIFVEGLDDPPMVFC